MKRYAVANASILVCWSVAWAVGGGSTQGTLFLGQGLDWQHTGTEQQYVPHFPISSFPPQSQEFGFKDLRIRIKDCKSPVASSLARCDAEATLLPGHSRSQLCGQWLPSGGGWRHVVLYALPGEIQDAGVFSGGILQFPHPMPGPPRSVTFACGITDPTHKEAAAAEWSDMGALGKCLHWPIDPDGGYYSFLEGAPGERAVRRFLTCVRAVRADYCGDGVTYTTDGTKIYLSDRPTGGVWSVDHDHDAGFKLEATWDERGAVCLHHARHALLSPECLRQFPFQRFPSDRPDKNDLYYCKSDAGFEPGILMDDSAIQQ